MAQAKPNVIARTNLASIPLQFAGTLKIIREGIDTAGAAKAMLTIQPVRGSPAENRSRAGINVAMK